MTERDGVLTLDDGRALRYAIFGAEPDATGVRTVLALHGTPGSRLKYVPADAAARQRGVALIAMDRWDYGDTQAPQHHSLPAFAQDVSQLMDHLGVRCFAVVGISGGGPYAVAVSAALPKRVIRCALPAPVGLIEPSGQGQARPRLSLFHQLCFRWLPRWPWAVRMIFRGYRRLLQMSRRSGIAMAMARSGPADRRLLDDPEIVSGLGGMMLEGLKTSLNGPAIDLKLFGRCQHVNISAIKAPCRIWFGDQDGSVPKAAIETLAQTVPGAQLVELKGQGHFWIATRFDEVLDWLAGDGPADSVTPSVSNRTGTMEP